MDSPESLVTITLTPHDSLEVPDIQDSNLVTVGSLDTTSTLHHINRPSNSQTPGSLGTTGHFDSPCSLVKTEIRLAEIDGNVQKVEDKQHIWFTTDVGLGQADDKIHIHVQAASMLCEEDSNNINPTTSPKQHFIFDNVDQPVSAGVRHVCELPGCGREFSTLGYLKVHQMLHNGQKALSCNYQGCNRKFAWPAHLNYHKLTHTGQRSFVCQVPGCGKAFYTSQRLTVHTRIHTGERPFLCPFDGCLKLFSTAGNLKNHTRTHSGSKPYKCDVKGCGKQFTEYSSLKKHGVIHSGKKPFSCEVCGQEFTQSGSRNVHMRKNHPANLELPKPCKEETMADIDTTQAFVIITANGETYQCTDQLMATTDPQQLSGSTGANVVVLSRPEDMITILNSGTEIVCECNMLEGLMDTVETSGTT